MQRIVQFSESEEARAIQILFRQFNGTILRDRVYVLSDRAVETLSQAGISFTELSRETAQPQLDGALAGERI
jgi:hypothetical protein